MHPERFSVYLMGASLGTPNRGVSALGASLVSLVLRDRPLMAVSMLIGHRTAQPFELRLEGETRQIPVLNFRLSPKAGFQEHLVWWFLLALLYRLVPFRFFRDWLRQKHRLIRASAEADLIGDIRGGDSFSDIYGLGNFLWGSLPVIAVLLVRREIVLFPQTYGPFKSRLARMVAKYIVKRASHIICRDRESLDVVKELTGRGDRARFCPDVAFCLEAISPRRLVVHPSLDRVERRHLVGLNVSGLVFNGGYTRANMFGLTLDYPRFVLQFAQSILADAQKHLLLVPHTFALPGRVESDPVACRKVWEQLPPELQQRTHLLEGEYDQSEIKIIIGMCDFFVGSRMHACIAALSQGIPAVGVAYSKKFRGVFETVGAEDSVIDGRELKTEEALAQAVSLYSARELTRARLQARVEEARSNLYSVFQGLFKADAVAGASPVPGCETLPVVECAR